MSAQSTVALPAEEVAWPQAAPPPERAAPLLPGMRLGRYQLLAKLGEGGMALVFRARDGWLRRQVAVKVLNPLTAAQPQAEQRFRQEALAVASLNHRNVLQVFDFVPDTGADPSYLVCELVEGPSLRRLLDRQGGRLAPELAGLIAWQLAEALRAVHAAGIVHRDLKPDNVLLGPGSDGGGRVVLTDFGVADVVGLPPLAPPGSRVGSPAYMSPEQARGEPVGPASDQWALGLLMYEMATGRLPASQRRRDLAPGAGRAFDDICTRCLQLQPERRYADAAALAERLAAYCRERQIGPSALGRVLRRR